MLSRLGLTAMAVLLIVSGCADRQKSSTSDARIQFSGPTDFQRVPMFAEREVQVKLQNVGRSRLNVLDIWVEDQDGAYLARFGHEGVHDLTPGGECEATIKFRPRRPGSFPAKFVVRSDSHQEPVFKVDITGLAVDARAVVNETRLDFGRIEVGSEKVKTLTLENTSDLTVKVTPTVVGADKSEFLVEPLMLGAGEKRTIDVKFAPSREGVKQAAIAVQPCEGCADQVVALIAEGLDRAVIARPTLLDFGQVPMDREATLPLQLQNISTEPQEVLAHALTPNTDASFTHVSGETPVVLQAGETRDFEFRYSPGHMGIAQGAVSFNLTSKRNPTLDVEMVGFGGAPELCVSPAVHEFSPKPVGSRVSVGVTVKNCGTSNAAPLTVTEIVVGASPSGVDGEDQFSVSDVTLPRTLAAGEELTFRVYYEPTRVGAHATRVGIRTNGFQASVGHIDVSGSAVAHEPCRLAITPGAVDFGTVLPDHDAVLGVKVNNIGTDVCPVKNIEIVDDGGGVFRMPGGDISGVIVYAGYYFSFMVQFDAPLTGGTFSGMLKIEQSDPANPVIYVPLVAHSQQSCLVAAPTHLDFGLTRPDCPASPMSTTLMNACTTPVQINSVAIAAGTTDGEFVLTDTPSPLPARLDPGETVVVGVNYLGQVTGLNLSPLFVGVDGLARPLLVPLIGESSEKGDVTERFVQQDGTKVDVLFVVDNTASMVEEHPKLVAAIPSFVSAAQAKNVDLHVAVTTTGLDQASAACPGGAMGGEAGRFFPVDNSRPRILTLGTPNLAEVLQQNVQVGQCAYIEQGFEAVRRALTQPLVDRADDPRTSAPNDGNAGFLREEAALAVIFVGDEDDHSPDDVDTYVDWLRSLKGMNQPQRSVIYAIAPTTAECGTAGGSGTRYAEAAAKTGGDVLSICAPDYAPILSQVASQAFSPQDRFALSSTPEPGSLRVFVNGTEQFSGWRYDGAKNQVVFAPQPAAGAAIDMQYRKACD